MSHDRQYPVHKRGSELCVEFFDHGKKMTMTERELLLRMSVQRGGGHTPTREQEALFALQCKKNQPKS